MSGGKAAIFAVYPTHASAEAALSELKARGFAASDISVVAPHAAEAAAAATAELAATPPEPKPATAGSGAVPAIGVALGWLVNLSTVAVSGAMYVAAGPVMAVFKGMSDAMLGIVDALVKFGIPSDTAKKYEERVKKGATLLSIHADDPDWITRGREIFEQTGAEDVASTFEGMTVDRPGLTVPHTN